MHVYGCMLFVNFYLHVTTNIALVVCCLSTFIYMYHFACLCVLFVNIMYIFWVTCTYIRSYMYCVNMPKNHRQEVHVFVSTVNTC